MNETLTILRNASGRPIGRLLEGEDDGAPYSVRVPLRCRTVDEALDWLRPAGVSPWAPRQGELFFVPEAPPAERDCILEEHTPAGSSTYTRCDHRIDWPIFGSDHVADDAVIVWREGWCAFIGRRGRIKHHRWEARPVAYVRGEVRHPEHGTLVLDGWHRVVPNRASRLTMAGRLNGD